MKKILLTLGIILAIASVANAQWHRSRPIPRPRPRPHFSVQYYPNAGEIRLHLAGELGISDPVGLFWHQYPQHYSVGAMVEAQAGRCLSFGLGAEYYGTKNLPGSYDDYTYLNTVPIYGNVRLSTSGRNSRLFVEARAGYAIATNQAEVNHPNRTIAAQGLYTGAGIGFDCYGSCLSIGFNSIDVRNVKSSQSTHHSFADADDLITDFYIRYSYAIPLN